MKTSNKILTGLMIALSLLWISFLMAFKMNTVPYLPESSIDYTMGDIKGLESDGPFNIRIIQYDGESRVKIKSIDFLPDAYAVSRDEITEIAKLAVRDTAHISARGNARINMKECTFFELKGSTEMHFANPVKEDVIDFILEDSSKTDVALEADSIHIKIGDKAEVHMKGEVRMLHLTIDNNGTFDGTNLKADEIILDINDNGDAALNPLKKITGKIVNKDNLRMNNAPPVVEIEGF